MEQIALERSTMQEQANLIAGSDKSSPSTETSPERSVSNRASSNTGAYRVYRRRWFGLAQLVLLNIIVSWDVSYSTEKAMP